jgi:hypothetical protein
MYRRSAAASSPPAAGRDASAAIAANSRATASLASRACARLVVLGWARVKLGGAWRRSTGLGAGGGLAKAWDVGVNESVHTHWVHLTTCGRAHLGPKQLEQRRRRRLGRRRDLRLEPRRADEEEAWRGARRRASALGWGVERALISGKVEPDACGLPGKVWRSDWALAGAGRAPQDSPA